MANRKKGNRRTDAVGQIVSAGDGAYHGKLALETLVDVDEFKESLKLDKLSGVHARRVLSVAEAYEAVKVGLAELVTYDYRIPEHVLSQVDDLVLAVRREDKRRNVTIVATSTTDQLRDLVRRLLEIAPRQISLGPNDNVDVYCAFQAERDALIAEAKKATT